MPVVFGRENRMPTVGRKVYVQHEWKEEGMKIKSHCDTLNAAGHTIPVGFIIWGCSLLCFCGCGDYGQNQKNLFSGSWAGSSQGVLMCLPVCSYVAKCGSGGENVHF